MVAADCIVSRRLRYELRGQTIEIDQSDLLGLRPPLVVLGDAGMGKTALTHWLDTQAGYVRCTARQLVNHPNPATLAGDASALVIDALDELSATGANEAVDSVLRALARAGFPPFVLTCRASDWRSRTSGEAIREQYGIEPLEVEMLPLDPGDVLCFATSLLGKDGAEALERFEARNLSPLLGNPQTLLMLIGIYRTGRLPENTTALFKSYTEVARTEHSETRPNAALQRLAADAALDALGAAFAALILTGTESLTLPHKPTSPDALPFAELSALPNADALELALQSRLVVSTGEGRVSYPHRRIGEYLGARWLARQADTPRKRRRLLKLFHSHGLVPASLRGMHAWLANDPALAAAVIAADPMGVVEYGDADNLTPSQGRVLLEALETLAARYPHFRDWGPYSARGIAQLALLNELRRLIVDTDTPFGLRLLVVEQIKGTEVAKHLAADLHRVLLDGEQFAVRSAAADVLVEIDREADWATIGRALLATATEDSLRLGIEIASKLDYAPFGDDLLGELFVGYTQTDSSTVGVLHRVERDFPDDRLDAILDRISAAASLLGDRHDRPGNEELTDLAYRFLARRVALGGVDPERLWSWLEPFDAGAGYQRETRDQLASALASDDDLRQSVQRHVLLNDSHEQTVWMRGWRLLDRSSGLALSPSDALAFISQLGPPRNGDDEAIARWKDVVALAQRGTPEHAQFLLAVRELALGNSEFLSWLDDFASPAVPEWKLEQERRQKEREEERLRNRQEHRDHYVQHRDEMVAGEYGAVVNPAKAYLKMFRDIGDGIPAHERVGAWLGPDLAEAAHAGFEAFLQNSPKPTATDIATSHAEGRQWPAAQIIVAALAERLRTGRDFADLPEERVLAGLFEVRHSRIDDHAGIDGLLAALENEIRSRGVWEEAQRAWFEPQLERSREHVAGLYGLMRGDDDVELAGRLAKEWLARFPKLPAQTEIELVDRLIQADDRDALLELATDRRRRDDLDRDRKLNWDAVALFVDFSKTARQLESSDIDRDLLWALRNRLGGGRWDEGRRVQLDALQVGWIVRVFRTLYAAEHHPIGATSGDTNPWDASEYLHGLIRRLGEDTSDAASDELARLRHQPVDGYTEYILTVSAEHERKRVEQAYTPPSLDAVAALVRDQRPTDPAGLQAVVVEELTVLGRRLSPGGDPADIREGFLERGRAKSEEQCRNHLLVLLRGTMPFGIELRPESHLAADKEVDIEASLGGDLMVPIEIKGQWHRDLWHAADTQLSRLYADDWRAERRGIYVVFWFGDASKPVKGLGHDMPVPTSAEELREGLIKTSPAAQSGLVEVVVLDVSPPAAS